MQRNATQRNTLRNELVNLTQAHVLSTVLYFPFHLGRGLNSLGGYLTSKSFRPQD